MDSNITEIIEEFMESALAQWVQLFEKTVESEDVGPLYSQYMEVNSVSQSALERYLRLTSGIFLNEVMRVIDPNPKKERLYKSGRDDHMLRVQNFSILNRHLRAFYQEDLQQLIMMSLPNVAILGQDPLTEAAVEELRRLLLLLLGCAVQCERKETFIQQIQSLDIQTQATIASCIQEVTQDPRVVLPLQWEELMEVEGADLQLVFSSMAKQIQSLLAQRDTHLERIAELCREREAQADSTTGPLGGHSTEPPQGLALQLADSKAKLRRLKQQLQDKDDQILDNKQDIQSLEEQLKKLQKENRSLQGEIRGIRALRDELDCARERATRAEQLQSELQGCKHRLRSLELTRTQLKEQQQLCAALQETKALLEEQLSGARARCESVRELERDNLLLRQKIMVVEAERDTERQRVDELLEMNMSLEADLRLSSSSHVGVSGSGVDEIAAVHRRFLQLELDSDEELSTLIDQKPLSVEVDEASTLRLLGAEQENAELRRRLEELQVLQEADSLLDTKNEHTCLEAEHQDLLTEFHNLKNQNVSLKQQLEQAMIKMQSPEGNMEKGIKKPEKVKEVKDKQAQRGVQGCEISRGEGEGGLKEAEGRESRGEIIGTRRESGVGEEILLAQEKQFDGETVARRRGEAEGGWKEKERQDKEGGLKKDLPFSTTSSGTNMHPKSLEVNTQLTAEDHAACCSPSPDVELLITQLQKAHEEADRQTIVAQELHSKLGEQSKKTWEAEQRLMVLEAELQRLKKAAESLGEARRQIEVLHSEGLAMEEELCRLRSQAELHRIQTTVIATLEGERAALERDKETLRSTVDALRNTQRKSDQMELNIQTLKAEVERQGRSLETSRRREEELDAELHEASKEVQSLTRARDQAQLEAARLEQERDVCQLELDGQRREGRQREREVARLKQQLESTTLALEHSNQRARTLDSEHRHVCQQLSESKELCTQLQDLEKDLSTRLTSMEEGKQQLQQQYSDAQTKISSLSQELSTQKARSQELSSEVERLNKKVEKAEAERKVATDSLSQSQDRIKSLSLSLKESESLLLLEKRRRSTDVDTLSNSNPDSSNQSPICQTPATEMTPVDQRDGVGKDQDLAMSPDDVIEGTERQRGERITELEKEKAVAIAGQEALLSRLSQSQEMCEHLKEQLEALHRHSLILQDSCTQLQTLNTKLQMEQASLSSQLSSALAHCSESEARCATLEAESKVWVREREESTSRMEALRRDHERMTALQQRQEVELEELLDKHSQLRSNNRSLEAQYRELEARYKEILDRKTQMEEREREMKTQKEGMEAEAQRRLEQEQELERLKEDNERLQAHQKEWLALQTELLAQGSMLRGELSASQLERTRQEGELSVLRETNQSLDLSNARLTSQYQLLTQLKGNMEEENRQLAEQNQSLLKENRALLEQSLERRDQHYSQQKEYQEKLSELRREKQKLVEKIMDQYRVLEPSMQLPTPKAKKSNWIADRMKKLMKPRGGGGGREGRALFTAAGSVENLADSSEFSSDTHTPQPDPRSAPVSPSPLRKTRSQTEPVTSVPGTPASSGSGSRRKLGSRHGWGLGLSRGGSGVSQSFSPGDNKTHPRQRLRSSQTNSTVLWEKEKGAANECQKAEAELTNQESVEEEEGEEKHQLSDDSVTT